LPKKLQSQAVIREKLRKTLLFQKNDEIDNLCELCSELSMFVFKIRKMIRTFMFAHDKMILKRLELLKFLKLIFSIFRQIICHF